MTIGMTLFSSLSSAMVSLLKYVFIFTIVIIGLLSIDGLFMQSQHQDWYLENKQLVFLLSAVFLFLMIRVTLFQYRKFKSKLKKS